jgi:hypothetical protein
MKSRWEIERCPKWLGMVIEGNVSRWALVFGEPERMSFIYLYLIGGWVTEENQRALFCSGSSEVCPKKEAANGR